MRIARGEWLAGVALAASASALLPACFPDYSFGEADGGRPDATSDVGAQPDVVDAKPATDGGGTDASDARTFDVNPDGPLLLLPDAAGCTMLSSPADLGNAHVDAGTVITYSSEPASSGPHYAEWTAFKEFTSPVPPGNYVHTLEHGAIALSYHCPSNADCETVKQHLRDVLPQIPNDVFCNVDAGQQRIKWLIFPNPKQDVPIAAVTWGKLYKATCIDPAALKSFAQAHYGNGGETRCDEGSYR
jgi:hypothetical protein